MADHDDLDDILDSALDDFRTANGGRNSTHRATEESPAQIEACESASLGQGLGIGLPALGPRGKKEGCTEAKSGGKTSSSLKPEGRNCAHCGHLPDALEELAHRTRQTLEGIGTNDEEAMADKLLENIVKQFEELGSSQDMQSIMDTMMQQILSKDVLQEPMKEFCERYPNWLEANKSTLSDGDFSRYSRQYECIKELCGVYDTTPDDFQRIVDIMQNMQACGQPPSDLVQELAPGMDLGGDGVPLLSDFLQEGDQGAELNQICSVM